MTNERIRELTKQVDGVVINKMMIGTKQYTFLEKDLEKFAELIVRECAELVKDFYQEDEFTCYSAATEIQEHFGVEE
jgi:hypothetical protein